MQVADRLLEVVCLALAVVVLHDVLELRRTNFQDLLRVAEVHVEVFSAALAALRPLLR